MKTIIKSIDNTNNNSKDKHKERKGKEKDLREAIKRSNWGKELRVGSANCKGMLEKKKREQIAYQMENHKIDIRCLQETHINTNSMENVDGYTFIYSS